MKFRFLNIVLAAAVMLSTVAFTAFADTEQAPAKLYLEVGEVEDGEFSVDIDIDSQSLITNASLSVSYDTSIVEYESSVINDETGGMAVENSFEGKYVFNYVNRDGADFDGTYATLNFKLIDDSAVSTVLYLSVTSFDDDKLSPISYTVENGIVKNGSVQEEESSTADDDLRSLTAIMSDKPFAPEEIGLENVESCQIDNGEVLIFEDGMFTAMETGTTVVKVTYTDGSEEAVTVSVVNETDVENLSEADSDESSAVAVEVPEKGKNSLRNGLICLAVMLAIIALIVEYLVIFKPFARIGATEDEDNFDDTEDTDEEEETDESEEDEQEEVESEETEEAKEVEAEETEEAEDEADEDTEE
jgi:hypothetical protein